MIVAAFGVTSCSSNDSAPVETIPGIETESPDTSEETPDVSEDTDTSQDAESSGDLHEFTQAALDAIALVETETGGVAYEIDAEDNLKWEIEVNVDGNEIEVDVNWEGTEILSTEPDGLVSDKTMTRLAEATLTIQEAITAATPHVNGYLDEAELDTENGVLVWELSFEDDPADWDIDIDAQTGEVVRVKQD